MDGWVDGQVRHVYWLVNAKKCLYDTFALYLYIDTYEKAFRDICEDFQNAGVSTTIFRFCATLVIKETLLLTVHEGQGQPWFEHCDCDGQPFNRPSKGTIPSPGTMSTLLKIIDKFFLVILIYKLIL